MIDTHAPSTPQPSVRPASPPRPLPSLTTTRPRPPPPQEERPSKSSRSSCGCTPTAAASTCARPSRGGACGWWSRRRKRRGARGRKRGTGTVPYVCVCMGDCTLCFIRSVCLSDTDTCIHYPPKSSKNTKGGSRSACASVGTPRSWGRASCPVCRRSGASPSFLRQVFWYDSDTH